MFVLIYTFLLFLVSEVSCGKEVAHFSAIFAFFANFATIKKLYPKI